jgi:hypothetical protein
MGSLLYTSPAQLFAIGGTAMTKRNILIIAGSVLLAAGFFVWTNTSYYGGRGEGGSFHRKHQGEGAIIACIGVGVLVTGLVTKKKDGA